MTSTGWGAVSTLFKGFGMTRTRTQDLPIQILLCYYWAKSAGILLKIQYNMITNYKNIHYLTTQVKHPKRTTTTRAHTMQECQPVRGFFIYISISMCSKVILFETSKFSIKMVDIILKWYICQVQMWSWNVVLIWRTRLCTASNFIKEVRYWK